MRLYPLPAPSVDTGAISAVDAARSPTKSTLFTSLLSASAAAAGCTKYYSSRWCRTTSVRGFLIADGVPLSNEGRLRAAASSVARAAGKLGATGSLARSWPLVAEMGDAFPNSSNSKTTSSGCSRLKKSSSPSTWSTA